MYSPSARLLEKYANVLINFALNSGKGIKKNDTVYLVTQTPGLPLTKVIYRAILESGGNPLLNIIDDDFKLLHLQHASRKQLSYFPDKYYRGLADEIDHWVRILADEDPMYLKKADPRKIMTHKKSMKPFRDWLDKKEDAGIFTWTLCLSGTEGQAKEAGLTQKEYWQQIVQACFLNETDPIAKWKSVMAHMKRILKTINAMPINKLHLKAPHTDLWITVGEKRKWLGGSGRNIPSFEIFTSPDWRGTQGTVFFDLPLYVYGNIIRDITLEFRNGKIVKAKARKNEKLLLEMIKQKNADKTGEYSLTDRRFSKINKFMANTLYDENFGGKYGNTHLAIGKSYHDACSAEPSKMSVEEYARLGFNDSVEHTDIIATSDREVTALLKDGSTKQLYAGGEFQI
ncbi:MAG: aminopeptidase [Chitinivibrionales bacterium]|nr:aminopeptidase [Chitinivibrionales bacterium]